MMNEEKTCTTIFEYIKRLEGKYLDDLYSHPPTCLIVFRELPEVAKHIALRLLFIDQPIPNSIIQGWIDKNFKSQMDEAILALVDLRLCYSSDVSSARASLRLNKRFQECMKVALFGGSKPLLGDLGSTTADKYTKDRNSLSAYATERWNSLLYFMVGLKTGEVSNCVKDVLVLSGLMKGGSSSNESIGITERGFKFLLTNRSSQVLFFLLSYFDFLKERPLRLVEALQFIFQLSFLSMNKSYPTDNLTATQLEVLQHMREFGLAYKRKRTANRFYVTDLTLSIACGSQSSDEYAKKILATVGNSAAIPEPGAPTTSTALSTVHDSGYIIIETNYRMYAYTDSDLQTALLSLFSTIRTRFPNLVVADITRSAVRQALQRGITAEQIISFLLSNAHPSMKSKPPFLPPTVVDQIKLWEMERNRFTFMEGCLYDQFAKSTDFEMVRDHARSINVLLWENPEQRLVVVSKTGHDEIRKFWKTKRPQ